jgi:hypothetical protein
MNRHIFLAIRASTLIPGSVPNFRDSGQGYQDMSVLEGRCTLIVLPKMRDEERSSWPVAFSLSETKQLTHSLIHSLTHSRTHSLTNSLTQYQHL